MRWTLPTVPVLLLVMAACEPVGPIAGGELSGETAALPDDWTTAHGVMLFQLETRPTDPYSVNLWGVVVDGRLYIASGDGPDSNWVDHLTADSAVRLRIGERLYALRAVRVQDLQEMEAVRLRYIEKYEIEDAPDMEGEFGEDAWVYRLDPP